MIVPRHLKHLRRDRRGVPVPHVNRWGKREHVLRFDVQWDPYVGGPAVFYDDSLEPEPDFTCQNMQRQRESALAGRCQVCWVELLWPERNLVVASVSTETVTTPGPLYGGVVVTEPWLCDLCCEFAIERCPALIRRRREEGLSRVRIASPNDVQIAVSTGSVDGKFAEETKLRPVAIWAKIALPGIVLQRVGVEQIEAAREAQHGPRLGARNA